MQFFRTRSNITDGSHAESRKVAKNLKVSKTRVSIALEYIPHFFKSQKKAA